MKDIIEAILAFFKDQLGSQIPPWLSWPIVILALVYMFLWLLDGINQKFRSTLRPLFYSEEKQLRAEDLHQLLRRLQTWINTVNSAEAWSDREYTEIETEVEASGKQRTGWLPFGWGQREGVYREKSISKALQKSEELWILLQGEPGSGKSVALRHLAGVLIERGLKIKTDSNKIPLYINLRELKPEPGEVVNGEFIARYVKKTLCQLNEFTIENFLFDESEQGFKHGLDKGYWLFLFDSFDEIPEVLSSQGDLADTSKYMDAITAFMDTYAMNCRVVLASRPFRQPEKSGWAIFRILPLTERYQRNLIRKIKLKNTAVEKTIIGQLGNSRSEIHAIMSNPMLLRLLCEYMRDDRNPFPQNLYSIFEKHIASFFQSTRGQTALKRHKATADELRRFAEDIAFYMTAYPSEGLRPSREFLKQNMAARGLAMPDEFDEWLNALEDMKLARQEVVGPFAERTFSFRHRRLQEYFATCVLLKDPNAAPPCDLLTRDLWRETAVTLLQTREANELTGLMAEAERMLVQMAQEATCQPKDELPAPACTYKRFWNDPATIQWWLQRLLGVERTRGRAVRAAFNWPEHSQHVIGIFQDGLSRSNRGLPDCIRRSCETILLRAFETGLPVDQKWALELAGVLSQRRLIDFISQSMDGGPTLKEVGFRQTTRLRVLPEKVSRKIRSSLREDVRSGQYWGKALTLQTFIERLPEPETPRAAMRIFRAAPLINFFLLAPLLVLFFIATFQPEVAEKNPVMQASYSVICEGRIRKTPSLRRSPQISG